MNDESADLAGLYVLDQLDPDERADFEARLTRDPELAALVRELEDGLARGVRSLPRHEPPFGLLAQIEEELDALPGTTTATQPAGPWFGWANFARWGIAAVVTVSLGTLAVQSLRPAPAAPTVVFVGLDQNRNTFADLPMHNSAKDPDARFMQLASLAENYWAKPDELPVKTKSTAGGNRGYALFDPGSQQGFIAIQQIPPIAENQRYHLWIIDPATAQVRDAGVLPLAGLNRGLYSFTVGPSGGDHSARPNFFITVEEDNAAPLPAQPRGKVVLGAQRI